MPNSRTRLAQASGTNRTGGSRASGGQDVASIDEGTDDVKRNILRLGAGLLTAAILGLGWQPSAQADDEDVITYRQLIMKEMDAESSALGMMLAGQAPQDALGTQARALSLSAKAALKAFQPKVAGGEAKADVWAKWDDFSKRLQTFVQGTDELAKVADSGSINAFSEKMTDALTCKQCHDTYRVKKN
jgi:cytochrome c556